MMLVEHYGSVHLEPGETVVAAVQWRDYIFVFTNHGRIKRLRPSEL